MTGYSSLVNIVWIFMTYRHKCKYIDLSCRVRDQTIAVVVVDVVVVVFAVVVVFVVVVVVVVIFVVVVVVVAVFFCART